MKHQLSSHTMNETSINQSQKLKFNWANHKIVWHLIEPITWMYFTTPAHHRIPAPVSPRQWDDGVGKYTDWEQLISHFSRSSNFCYPFSSSSSPFFSLFHSSTSFQLVSPISLFSFQPCVVCSAHTGVTGKHSLSVCVLILPTCQTTVTACCMMMLHSQRQATDTIDSF